MESNISKSVIVIGAGGHARVLLDTLVRRNVNVIGLVTPDKTIGSECFGFNVLGDDSIVSLYESNEVLLVNGIGSLPDKTVRSNVADQMKKQGYKFASVIHPSAIIAKDVEIEDGVQIMANVVVQSGSTIGEDSIINTGVCIDHDCAIESNCHIAPGVTISGGVRIGKSSHLGTGTIVVQNISIGSKCVIAAGSVIYRDVVDNTRLIQKKQIT